MPNSLINQNADSNSITLNVTTSRNYTCYRFKVNWPAGSVGGLMGVYYISGFDASTLQLYT